MIFRFGDFELDESRRELRRDGTRIDTEPKTFDMLLYLVSNHDRAVSKDELQEQLWPRTIVSETALTRSIMKARRAVGDDASTQGVIRTLHSHGYQFIAELIPDPSDVPEAAVVETTTPMREATPTARPTARWSDKRWHIVAAIVLVLTTAGFWLMNARTLASDTGALAVLPIENKIQDESLGWVRLGLMGLMKRMLSDAGTEVASERAVMRVVGDAIFSGPPDEALAKRLRLETDAGPILNTTLDLDGELYRLAATITHVDGHRTRRVIVGESAAALASEMAELVSSLLTSMAPAATGRFASVSTDPFINEAYARALDMELRGDYSQAIDLFQLVVSQEPELWWPRYEIAICHRNLREFDLASEQLGPLIQEARTSSDTKAYLAGLNSLGVSYWMQSKYDAAKVQFEEGLQAAVERGLSEDTASIHVNMALVENRLDNLERAKYHYGEALKVFEAAGEEPAPSFYNNYAGLLKNLGDLDTARVLSEKAVAEFRVRGQRVFEAHAINRLAKIMRAQGDLDGALERHEQSLAIFTEMDHRDGAYSAESAMISVYRAKGDLTRAQLLSKDVIRQAIEMDDKPTMADAYMHSAMVNRDMQNYAAALADYELAYELFSDGGDANNAREANRSIAATALELGDYERAKAIANELEANAETLNNESAAAEAVLLQANIAAKTQDYSTAETLFINVLDYARSNGDNGVLGAAASGYARLSIELGNLDLATSLVNEVRDLLATRHDFMRLDADLAFVLGENDQARTIMSELRAVAGEGWRAEDEAFLSSL